MWPESPLLEGRLPRGAGFITLHAGQSSLEGKRLYVCLVTKQSGVESYPKGDRGDIAPQRQSSVQLRVTGRTRQA